MSKLLCGVCELPMKKVQTSIEAGWGDYDLTIKGVQAYECQKCGYKVYDPEEVDLIQDLSEGFSKSPHEKPTLLNVEETADLLRVSKQSVYNMIKDGRLRAIKMGREWRFNRKDIESIIEPDTTRIAARGDLSERDREIIKRIKKNNTGE